MKKILGYLSDYLKTLHPGIVVPSLLFVTAAVYINYHFNLNDSIEKRSDIESYFAWLFIFLISFSFAYVLLRICKPESFRPDLNFWLLILIAAALFSVKMAFPLRLPLSSNADLNKYYNAVIYFPFKLVVMLSGLWLIWKWKDRDQPFYGTSVKEFDIKPYLLMLVIMLPVIAIAATQDDFKTTYPKVLHLDYFLNGNGNAWEKLLYELSYGTDFISIEFFFRGFLILAFVKWAGKDAILPMAIFYCTIHFGKPIGECISSFFGGILLGAITYHTRTIWGGLIVHLGIAWLMELGGILEY